MIRSSERKKGSAIAFGTSLALVLVVLGLGFLAFSMYMGAQNETKNAVDAGALNVARQVIDNVSVNLSADPKQQFFNDVTPGGNGVVNLRNINRVWGKAMFVSINSDGANNDSGNAGATAQNVSDAHDGAQAISDALAAKLNDATQLYDFFKAFATANSVRMIGNGANTNFVKGNGWQTSLMDRNDESNLQIMPNLPLKYNLKSSYSTPCTRAVMPQTANGLNFLRGYLPMVVAGQTFWQVPFQFDEKPRLVSKTPFTANQQPPNMLPSVWQTPVPNAFSVQGEAAKTGAVSELASAFVQTNPRQVFPLTFPNGYVRVVLKQNTLQWFLDLIPLDSTTYSFEAGTTIDSIPYPIPPICATAQGEAIVGNEYVPPTLYFAVCGNSPPIPGNTMNYLLQRCQEMLPGTQMGDLTAAMSACPISSDDADQTFYIYPAGGHIVVTPDSATNLPSGCDKTASPEGTSQTLDVDGPNPIPNSCIETWTCYSVVQFPTVTLLTNTRTWKPGTGYSGGCLGELTVHHESDAQLITAVCACP
jgi:Flp pilus assembly protein TadG